VDAVAMVSNAETETEKEQEEAAAASEELPVMPWATSVAR
jgi:malate dehydrogenase (oxaloacetate-decarboxylating)(NADP+)